jgi:diguanylate cyclase (GGDEF)-like protein
VFFKKSTSSEQPIVVPRAPLESPEDSAIDSAAALIRTYGQFALDTDSTTAEAVQRSCDDWALSISMGRPALGEKTGSRRDWGGLLRFFEKVRSSESDFVRRSQTSLRAALQQFATCLAHSLAADRRADGEVEHQLQSLAASLDTNNPEQIRANAERVLKAARITLLERRQREARQVEVLADKFNQLKSELLEARTQATTDGLTQLYNRNALEQHLERITDWGILFKYPPALLFVDVDHFKSVNDSAGHAAGDRVLRALGDVLTRCFLRRQDFVARYGGEEFAIVVVETPREILHNMADRLLESVRKMRVPLEHTEVEVSVSLGIAHLNLGERPLEWVERADRALYEAKRRGRDRRFSAV